MTIGTLSERVERIERANRRLMGIACFLAMSALALFCWAARKVSPATIDAQRFILRDGRGRIQADLRATADKPGFVLLDAQGTERLRLCSSDDGSTVFSIVTSEGQGTKRRIELRAAADGWSALSLLDEKDVERLTVGLAYDGEPRLRMNTPGGKSRISIGSDMSGRAEVIVHDGSGTERGVLRSSPGGSTSFSLYDAEGNSIFSIPGENRSNGTSRPSNCGTR